jgi:hypothetical protein
MRCIFWRCECAKIKGPSFTRYAGSPSAAIAEDAAKPACRRPRLASSCHVLLMGANAQVCAPIVAAIVVDVINVLACWRTRYDTM